MMEVEDENNSTRTVQMLTGLLEEFSAIVDYRVLRDSLPGRLASLLRCRCVLLYQRVNETLQLAAGSFDDKPGWSAALLAIAHINPLGVEHDVPEAHAWRERCVIAVPTLHATLVAVPLIYRQRCIGVLTVYRDSGLAHTLFPSYWGEGDMPLLQMAAGIVALLLENTRLLARDQERIQELALLNNFASQMYGSLYEEERIRTIVLERAREITRADQCAFIFPEQSPDQSVEWLPPQARALLFERCRYLHSLQPLVIERAGNAHDALLTACLSQLAPSIKTLFIVPLMSGRGVFEQAMLSHIEALEDAKLEKRLFGVVVGVYRRPWKMRREDNTVLHVLANQASIVLENIHLISHVVEARNEARKLLHQVIDDHYFQELILRSIPSGVITTDLQGLITTSNASASAVLGYDLHEVIGQPLQKLVAIPLENQYKPQERPSRQLMQVGQERAAGVVAGTQAHQTVKMLNRKGQEIMLDVTLQPLCTERDERIGMLVTFTDVTVIYRLEEEKRRLDRLASLGEMAANVAHEVRNPLASIKISMQLLMEELVDSALPAQRDDLEMQESVSIVLKEVERLDSIVRDLLLFARPRQLRRTRCDLVAISEHVLRVMQSACTEAHILVQRAYEVIPLLWADVVQIEQILFNLYTNALQAMPDGGMLTVSCRVCAHEDRGWQAEEIWLELTVRDTGVGMTQEVRERIFQPFFTTKAHGIGLGLSITRRLVEDHGGTIHVESEEGLGSTLIIRLPLGTE